MWITFSASARESEDLISASQGGFGRLGERLEQSATWRGKPSHARAWRKRLKAGGWTTRLYGSAISKGYPWQIYPQLIGSSAGTPANPTAHRADEEASKTNAISGPLSCNLFGKPDLPECCSKTSQDTLRWGCGTCCPIWKAAVIERRGDCLARRKLARLMVENEYSSSLWPTPTANEDACGTPNGKMQKMLGNHPLVRGLPDQENPENFGKHSGPLNPDWVEQLMGFPTGWTDCGR